MVVYLGNAASSTSLCGLIEMAQYIPHIWIRSVASPSRNGFGSPLQTLINDDELNDTLPSGDLNEYREI